jgi:hypothetical protein
MEIAALRSQRHPFLSSRGRIPAAAISLFQEIAFRNRMGQTGHIVQVYTPPVCPIGPITPRFATLRHLRGVYTPAELS